MDDTISRAKAIEALSTITMYKGSIPYDTAVMRIEQLPPAQPTFDARDTQYNLPIGTDCISRQAAIDYFVTNVGFHDEDGYPIEDECELREIWTGYFDGIPSAQPKMGEWIHRPEIGWGEMWMCNQCGEKTISTVMGKPRYNFCPMCGAKMEGADDE